MERMNQVDIGSKEAYGTRGETKLLRGDAIGDNEAESRGRDGELHGCGSDGFIIERMSA